MIYLEFLRGKIISDISYSVQSIYLICNDARNYRLSYSNNDSLNTMINVGFPRSYPTKDELVNFIECPIASAIHIDNQDFSYTIFSTNMDSVTFTWHSDKLREKKSGLIVEEYMNGEFVLLNNCFSFVYKELDIHIKNIL